MPGGIQRLCDKFPISFVSQSSISVSPYTLQGQFFFRMCVKTFYISKGHKFSKGRNFQLGSPQTWGQKTEEPYAKMKSVVFIMAEAWNQGYAKIPALTGITSTEKNFSNTKLFLDHMHLPFCPTLLTIQSLAHNAWTANMTRVEEENNLLLLLLLLLFCWVSNYVIWLATNYKTNGGA